MRFSTTIPESGASNIHEISNNSPHQAEPPPPPPRGAAGAKIHSNATRTSLIGSLDQHLINKVIIITTQNGSYWESFGGIELVSTASVTSICAFIKDDFIVFQIDESRAYPLSLYDHIAKFIDRDMKCI
jgi:hypothetical protein